MGRFTQSVEHKLRSAGWFPGRKVDDFVAEWKRKLQLSDGFEMFPEAEKALSEFGGLEVSEEGPGRACAREPFALIPTSGLRDTFDEFSEHVGMKLYPLGEACGGNYYLAMGESGQVFFIMNHIRILGENIEEALENLIQGINAQEIIWSQPETEGESPSDD